MADQRTWADSGRSLLLVVCCLAALLCPGGHSPAAMATPTPDAPPLPPGTTQAETVADSLTKAKTGEAANDPMRAAAAYIRAGQLLSREGRHTEALGAMAKATARLTGVADTPAKARLLVELGVSQRTLALATSGDPRPAYHALRKAEAVAVATADHLTLSAALGYLAELYEDEQRLDEALRLARRAVFAAQEAGEPRLLYQGHWQTARLLNSLGDPDGAIAAYRLAIAESKTVREMSAGECQEGEKDPSRPLTAMYEEAVDLFLRRADSLRSQPEQREAALRETRETLELLKISELRNYFQDDCLAALQAKKCEIDAISSRTAIIYPVILSDRVEMLTSIGGHMQSYPVSMPVSDLTAEIAEFRGRLETRTSSQYLPLAQHLYDLLIRPMVADFTAARVDTLVFVPAGEFRTIPFDALHDGKQFLIASYATAITPGLDLTDPHPIDHTTVSALAVGITKSVQGFPSLPFAEGELKGFHAAFGGYELVNEKFQVAAMEKILRETPVGIVHIASHGNFDHDSANTFLLAFDQKLTMDRLSQYVGMFRFRDAPLELLTLSACQTAAGDDRAALGLAGVAVRAGARSALASLWFINDQASSTLIEEFYRHLQQPNTSKAEALRQAKLTLLRDRRYRHPAYWAPFLLINNWL